MLREQFLEGMSRAACTVSIVTTDGPAGRAGVTVSAMSSVSADTHTPSLLICIHHESSAAKAIEKNGVFCVNVLGDDQTVMSDTFAGRLRTQGGEKFERGEWHVLATGAPVLSGCLVAFDCYLRRYLRWGSHYIFIGELADIIVKDSRAPLIYANRAYGTAVPLKQHHVGLRVNAPADGAGDESEQRLAIGCFVTLAPYVLPALLARFAKDERKTMVSVAEGEQTRLIQALQHRQISVALTYDFNLAADIEIEVMAEVTPHVLLPADHPLALHSRVSLRELAEELMVLLDIVPAREYLPSLFAIVGLKPRIAYRTPSFEMVRSLVGHGFGYALLTTKPASNMTYDGKALVTRSLAETIPPRRVVLARMTGGDLPPISAEFWKHTRSCFRGYKPSHDDEHGEAAQMHHR